MSGVIDINDVLAVSDADTADNTNIMDVVGNKDDDPFISHGDAPGLLRYLKAGYLHAHGQPIKYPIHADAGEYFLTVTSAAAAATHGAKVEIIPANDVTVAFDLHWLEITDISATDEFEVKLWKGLSGAEVEIGSYCYARSSNFAREGSKAILIRQQAANERLSISIACDGGGSKTTRFAVEGHTYN